MILPNAASHGLPVEGVKLAFLDPDVASGPHSLRPQIVPARPLRENICRLVFVFLRLSSGWLALCQKFHSEKPEQ